MSQFEETGKHPSADYRHALGTYATGVTVVTAAAPDGTLAGVTANSFTSVSLDPPLVLWCLASSSESLNLFRQAGHFAVNILASDQVAIASHFARRQENKFADMDYCTGRGGAPLLNGCVTWLECRSVDAREAGDHWILTGEVEALHTGQKEALSFYRGQYGMALPLPPVDGGMETTVEGTGGTDAGLYPLMVQALHTYQERFESRQQAVCDSPFEARILPLIETDPVSLAELARQIQVSRAEMEDILAELGDRGVVQTAGTAERAVSITRTGKERAAQLRQIARQHDAEVELLLRSSGVTTDFRDQLRKLIRWGQAD